MGRDTARTEDAPTVWSFNPRARVGRDEAGRHVDWAFEVSIHAPAWGATEALLELPFRDIVSIHAPAWGATLVGIKQRIEFCQFQSTRPRGARPEKKAAAVRENGVSIHAPAWGATGTSANGDPDAWVSIHAPAWGATGIRVLRSNPSRPVSIHAPAWGATDPSVSQGTDNASFNPRARVGRDRRNLRT